MLSSQKLYIVKLILILAFCHDVLCESDLLNDTKIDVQNEDEEINAVDEEINADKKNISLIKNEENEDVMEATELFSSTLSMETEENVIKTSSIATSTSFPTSFPKEIPPESSFALWDKKGKICLLAKFFAVFTITYPSNMGEQIVVIDLPQAAAVVKGKCHTQTKAPFLHLIWDKFAFNISFCKLPEKESWIITSMEMGYDTSGSLFDGATNVGKVIAQSKKFEIFEVPLGKSYYCPKREVQFYDDDKQVARVALTNIHLQPYEIENGKFSTKFRCPDVIINGEEEPFVQDETIPLAVGCTLAIITLIILVGFSIHRAYTAAKVDYNSME